MVRQLAVRRARGLALVACAAVTVVATSALAVTHTWNGGNSFGPTAMNNGLNWSGGVPVSASANLTLVFPSGASNTSPNQNIASPPLELQAMQINDFYAFTGSGFRFNNLGAAPTLTNAGAFVTIPNAIQFQAPTTVITSTNGLQLTGQLSGTATFSSSVGTGNQAITIGGGASNSMAATVTANTHLDLNKFSAVASSFTLNGGVAGAGVANAIATGTNLTVNSPVVPANLSQFTYMNPAMRISAPQSVAQLVLNTGQIDIQSTFLTVTGSITATGNSVLVGFTGVGTSGLDLGGTLGKVIHTPSLADTFIVDGTITNGSFNKTGPGTLELLHTFIGGSTFTGQNTVTAGKLRGVAGAIGNNVLNNAVIELVGGAYTGAISGPGSVTITNFVTYGSLNTYGGGTNIGGGTLSAQPQYLHGTITGTILGSGLSLNSPTNQTINATLAGSLYIDKQGAGVATLSNPSTMTGQLVLHDGGLNFAASNALGTASLYAGNGPTATVTLAGVGSTTHASPLTLAGPIDINGNGNLTFTAANAKNTNFALTHSSAGATSIAGKFTLGAPGSIVVTGGSLTLGDAAAVGGFVAAGPITINAGGTLALNSLNFISLPDVTLNGGTLKTPNGYAIPLGAALQGDGTVDGRVASANGSSILASGNLDLGDAAHPAGVNLDGELYTGKFVVTLNDSNQSVLGSLTTLGAGPGTPGTLVTMSGAVVNFGRNVTGNGLIKSTNALANAVIMNGDTNGDSPSDYIEYSGYVKGVGTFNNVAFSGTFAPGLSPALVTVGNVILTSSNVLEIEVGGLLRGGQYDAIDVTGSLALNGQLKLVLINSFNPSAGDTFNIIDGPTTGTFSSFFLPPLNVGLVWSTANLYTLGEVQVVAVPEPAASSAIAALAGGTLLRARRARRASRAVRI